MAPDTTGSSDVTNGQCTRRPPRAQQCVRYERTHGHTMHIMIYWFSILILQAMGVSCKNACNGPDADKRKIMKKRDSCRLPLQPHLSKLDFLSRSQLQIQAPILLKPSHVPVGSLIRHCSCCLGSFYASRMVLLQPPNSSIAFFRFSRTSFLNTFVLRPSLAWINASMLIAWLVMLWLM